MPTDKQRLDWLEDLDALGNWQNVQPHDKEKWKAWIGSDKYWGVFDTYREAIDAAIGARKKCLHPGVSIDKQCPICGEWTGSVVMRAGMRGK